MRVLDRHEHARHHPDRAVDATFFEVFFRNVNGEEAARRRVKAA